MKLAPFLLALALVGCGGQSSTQPASTDPGAPTAEGTRPVRVESDETAPGPVRVDTESAHLSTGEAPLTSGELADPPPVEPP
jgi:hypothetical protein